MDDAGPELVLLLVGGGVCTVLPQPGSLACWAPAIVCKRGSFRLPSLSLVPRQTPAPRGRSGWRSRVHRSAFQASSALIYFSPASGISSSWAPGWPSAKGLGGSEGPSGPHRAERCCHQHLLCAQQHQGGPRPQCHYQHTECEWMVGALSGK